MQFRAQINQHVAATDQVQPGKWRVGCDVLPRERADVAHVVMNLISAVPLYEKSFQSCGRDVLFDRTRINSQARMFDHRLAQIGAENLDAHFGRSAAKRFQNANGKRINFFAACAAWHPRAKLRLSIFAFAFEQRRQETLLQRTEQCFVSKKARYVDEQIVKKRLDLLFVVAQEPRVLTYLFDPVQRHSSLDPPDQRAFLVGAEIDTHLLFQRQEDAAQIVRLAIGGFFDFLRIAQWPPDVGMIGDALDFARNFARRQNEIDKACADRAPRHRVELRALLILGERQTAGRFDRAQPRSAIAAGSGEDDADGARSTFFGERFKKVVDSNVEPLLTLNQR